MQLSTSYRLIEHIIQNDLHVKYANFIYLKTIYSNSCFFEYSIKSLADKTKKSRTFIKQNITFFLQQGWCRMHGNNLIFNSNNHLKQLYDIEDPHKRNLKFTDLESLKISIYDILFLNKKKQVDYIIRLKHDIQNPTTLKEHKRAKQILKGVNVKINEKFTISFAKLAELFNCSKSYAVIIIDKLINSQLWKKQKNIIVILKNVSKKFFKSLDLSNSHFFYNNTIFKSEANEYLSVSL